MSELVMIETNKASGTGTQTPDEYMSWAAPLAAERGTDAASVACDESGRPLTPPGYADACIDVSPTRRVIACRRVTGGAFLAMDNVDYLTEHWPLSIYNDPQRFGALENASTHWLYAGEWNDDNYPSTGPTTPVWDAAMARFSPDGTSYVFVEFQAQPEVVVWREDVATGTRTAIAQLPQTVISGDISFIGDGTWAVVGGGADMYILDVATGRFAKLPDRFQAACWDPAEGPSALLTAQNTDHTSMIGTYSLATGEWKPVCEIAAQVLGLDVSDDGRMAAVISARNSDHTPNVALIDPHTGSHELLLPLKFKCGAVRRTHRPRWLSRPQPANEPTTLSDGWTAALRQTRPTRTPEYDRNLYAEWLQRIGRRVEAVDADPRRVRLLSQLMALCFEAKQLNPMFPDAARQIVIPKLREIANRPIPAELQGIYTQCTDALEAMMR
jgi:hypothetical protein